MYPFEITLSAIVATNDDGIDARLAEIKIAARGKDVAELLRELAHAIIVSYEIAKDLDETPFARILNPDHFQSEPRHGTLLGEIDLPQNVAEALAIALHSRRPIRRIPVMKTAA